MSAGQGNGPAEQGNGPAERDGGQGDIAIVGMGVLFPGAHSLREYWTNLVEGNESISDVPPRRWDPRYYDPRPTGRDRSDRIYCRRGGFVDEVTLDDPDRFGLDRATAEAMDPEQLIALRVCAAAVEDAGGRHRLGDPDRVGVVLGRSAAMSPGQVRLDQRVRTAAQVRHTVGTLLPWLPAADLDRVHAAFTDALGPDPATVGPAAMPQLAAADIAARLDLHGTAYTVDAACASALVAVDAAVAELRSGRCDAVVTGGVHHCHDVTLWGLLSGLGLLSASQRSQPLHRDADGMLPGEGTGVLVLKRLADARAADDRIYAVVRGTGVYAGAPADRVDGPALAIGRAWAAAGLDPSQPDAVGLIEAHGAGTPGADTAEIAALGRVFGAAGQDNLAVVGSVKSMIGHTMAAGGAAGLIKAALAVHHGVLLPTLNCDQPHDGLTGTRFRPLAAACPWVSAGPRRAGVNAFGIGGVHAHVVLEQDPSAQDGDQPQQRITVDEPEQILRFAAATPEALIDLLDADDATVRRLGCANPVHIGPGSRLGLVGPTERRLAVARRVARGSRGGGWAAWRGRNDVWLSSEPLLAPVPGRIAFVFPGLEAQFEPRIADVAEHFGLPVPELSRDGVGAHGSSVLRIGRILEQALRRMGVVPDALAGHSIGEWNAMFASGVIDAADAEQVVFGPMMTDLAALDVDYASLACPVEQALEAIAEHEGIVLSHDNAPGQSVVCGPPDAIRELAAKQRKKNVLVQVLPFRSGFHTPLLAPYLTEIEQRIAEVPVRRAPSTELWSATLAGRYPSTAAEIRSLVLRHLVEPVRFRPMVLAMYEAGVRVFIQVGQGRLGNLVDDTLGFLPHLTIAANDPRRSGLDQLRRVAVALWVEGGVPDFDALNRAPGLAALRARIDNAPNQPAAEQVKVLATGQDAWQTAGQATGVATGSAQHAAVPIRLDLGAGLVTLDNAVLGDLAAFTGGDRAAIGAIDIAAMAEQAICSDQRGQLRAMADTDPIAAELLGLLDETAATAVAAVSAMAAGGGDDRAGGRRWLDRPEPQQQPIEALSFPLEVSVAAMPHLMDHCLHPQPRDWPDLTDLRPVVPATTLVALAMRFAEQAAPGRVAVGLGEIRFDRWLPAAPATEVPVAVQPVSSDTVSVAFGTFARAMVRVADRYPDAHRPLWPHDELNEEPPICSAQDLYQRRWLFHGPRFQGIIGLVGHSETHARAILNATGAPGSLLDAAGQMLAYFARVNLPDRYLIFPASIDRIDVYGPEPAAGTPVTCLMWVPWHGDDYLRAHLQLVVDGQVYAEVNGWLSRRFEVRPETDEAMRFPERHTLGQQMPGGWTVVAEQWSDLASRDMYAGRYLDSAERAEMAARTPLARRHWLLGRMAVKDAVRSWLWERGWGPVFPAQLHVANTEAGVPFVVGTPELAMPELKVSLAHSGQLAVAMVRGVAEPGGVGIDLEEVRDHPDSTVEAALTASEQALLAQLVQRTGQSRAQWFTRFWTAKEAVAKAGGTGLGGAPRRFVVELDPASPTAGDQLLVTAPDGTRHLVRLASISNPKHLAERDYVVASTTPAPSAASNDATADAEQAIPMSSGGTA